MKTSRGFTLIELLVVIAIIGILSSVVLASLNAARAKGKDATIKQQLSGMRAAAALIYDATGSYDSVCDVGSKTFTMFENAWSQARKNSSESQCMPSSTIRKESNGTALANVVKTATPDAWAAVIYMQNGNFYCVDWRGISAEYTTRNIGSAADVSCDP